MTVIHEQLCTGSVGTLETAQSVALVAMKDLLSAVFIYIVVCV